MYIDFHCHTKLTKKADFDLKYFNRTVSTARNNGLTALALTEHFHTHQFCEIYETLDKTYPYRDDYYDVNGFKVFAGIEVDIKENGHIVLIGRKEDICALRNQFPDVISEKDYPSFDLLIKMANEYHLLKIGAHPYREGRPLYHLPPSALQRLDFMEMNGKDINLRGKMIRLAKELKMPIVGGSDTHHPLQMGTVKNHLYKECYTVEEIKDCIINGEYDMVVSPWATLKNTMASSVKNYLKKVKKI